MICGSILASFPGLPHLQFLIACSICILQAIKNWRCGRPGNEASSIFFGIVSAPDPNEPQRGSLPVSRDTGSELRWGWFGSRAGTTCSLAGSCTDCQFRCSFLPGLILICFLHVLSLIPKRCQTCGTLEV